MHVMNLHGMKAEPSSPVRPRAAEATDRAALRYSPPRRSSDSANKLQAFHIDGNPALGKRKRLQHTSSIDAMPRISPKTSTSNNEEDRSISVRIIDQPPRVWYRDQKGRRTVFCMTVGIVDQLERFMSADHITGGYFTTTLLYENGVEVADKRIVELRKGAFFDPHASTVTMEIRIADISKNHQNQKFRVRVHFVWPNVTVAAAVSTAIHVLSKHVKKSLPLEMHLVKSHQTPSSGSSDDLMAVRTPPLNTPTPPLSPVNSTSSQPMPPSRPPTWTNDAAAPVKIANQMSMSRWCTVAHRVLTQIEWSPYPNPNASPPTCSYKCLWCQAVEPDIATAKHAESCMLKYLLMMIATDDTESALPPPAPLPSASEMQQRLATTNVYKPVPHTLSTVLKADSMAYHDESSRDLTLLSIGDLSTFATSAKSSTFDDALMLKSLSQVSVADYGAPSSCPTTAATTTLATDSTSHRHYMVDSTMHDALSRFTDSTICASNTEASVVVVGLSPLEGDGVSGGLPAFDGDWRLVGVYHHGPPRGGLPPRSGAACVGPSLCFMPIRHDDIELVWDANVNMEDEVRQMKEGTAGRRATEQYLALGDPGIGTLDKLKAAVLRRSIH
ncbi:hypothetical protein H310_13101 [Aphanomyces invadans]|uniref:Uncharacterized protein n=1 Tax=Aphanomyces invadans TaxID=157072 RepID=A0A024TH21_9STRA|nr:hypothetical protein H310_13101 [Aphanomyces invadans]ETV92657.1 hypothetical protein H310_13101 [Aphanomyces invadans]|eukprot:XP_008878693.1 hypothetical protein H310_13101 [Aphanomyces invadans]